MAFGIMDIVALAKAGYSVTDVKELIELSKGDQSSDSSTSISGDDAAGGDPNTPPADKSSIIPDGKEDSKNDNQDNKDSDDQTKIVDYKQKIADLEEKLSKLQSDNTHQNMADAQAKSDSEVLAELARSFM